jgi:hypothetical protein
MLFNIQYFFDDLEANPDKSGVCQKYFALVQPRKGIDDIRKMLFYQEYVSLFKTMPIHIPSDLESDFDFMLLQQLVAASFSSVGTLMINTDHNFSKFDFDITVHQNDVTATKYLHELWGFQILRLFEIYVEEQMNLAIFRVEDELEKSGIDERRIELLSRWNNHTDQLHFDIERMKHEAYLMED